MSKIDTAKALPPGIAAITALIADGRHCAAENENIAGAVYNEVLCGRIPGLSESPPDLNAAAEDAVRSMARIGVNSVSACMDRITFLARERDSAIGRYADMMRERDALRALLILAAKHMMCDRACLEGRGCVCGGKEAWNKIQDAITPPTSTTPDAKETK